VELRSRTWSAASDSRLDKALDRRGALVPRPGLGQVGARRVGIAPHAARADHEEHGRGVAASGSAKQDLQCAVVALVGRCKGGFEGVDVPAREVSLRMLDDYLRDSYGIVRGGEAQRAKRFSGERARWVAAEVWHPDQKGSFDAEGRYLLELPFRDDRELVLDILRHGGEVEVVAPVALQRKVQAAHAAAATLNG